MSAAKIGLGACAALLAGCSVGPRAQVLVTIDAESRVDAASDSVLVRIWGREGDGEFDEQLYLEEVGIRYPWTVALAPRADDASRIFRFEATAYAGDSASALDAGAREFVAQARVISGYQRGQILHVYLLLQNACIGVPCSQLSESCRDGRCESIPDDPVFFDPDAGFPDAGAPPCAGEPGAPEACNAEDDDCDGMIDEDFDFLNDLTNCGGCGMDCARPNASEVCARGTCRMDCDAGWADCNMRPEDGCETDLLDPASCGECGTQCPESAPFCQLGDEGPECVLACEAGLTDCGGACVDTRTSTAHCGGCGAACAPRPHATTSCGATGCVTTCDGGFASCGGGEPGDEDGCETATDTISDCGSCGARCETSAPCRIPVCGESGCGTVFAPSGESCDTAPNDCRTYTCRTDGACAFDPVPDGTPCDDGGGCAGDTCQAGACRPAPGCADAGPPDAGLCDAGVCSPGQRCCGGNECCDDDGVTTACCGVVCCDLTTSVCVSGDCRPRDAGPPDAGRDAGPARCDDGPCPSGQQCCGMGNCCPDGTDCCDFDCCESWETCEEDGRCHAREAGPVPRDGGVSMGLCDGSPCAA